MSEHLRTIATIVLVALPAAAAPASAQEAASAPAGSADDESALVGSAPVSSAIDDPTELAQRIDRILADPALLRAHVGLTVQVAETGEVLYERAGEKRFTPASNTKLVTGAVGLDVLGPDYRWVTRLTATGNVEDGLLDGDLWIVGSGDPSLTREEVEQWVRALESAGIERITGDVIADDRVFTEPQWGQGWMWDDLYGGWSAGVTGLQIAPNTLRAAIVPGAEPGDSTELVYRDPGPRPPIVNRVLTATPGSDTRLTFVPPAEGGPVELRGWVPPGEDSTSLYLATPHATVYLLDWLRLLFAESGLAVDGELRRARRAEAAPEPGSGWTLETSSAPFSEVLAEMMKPSDNQMAESILRTIAVDEGRPGSPAEGLEVVSSTLAGWGIDPGAVDLADGSGLSRYNEVTPNALARLLRAMWRHEDYGAFLAALPSAGVDGTMRRRMVATPGYDNVRAKTGSLSAVRGLSGYLVDGSGETLVFSLLLNGYDSPGAVAVALEDLLIEQVALYRRPVEPGWPDLRREP